MYYDFAEVNNMTMYERIKELRQKLKMSQEELASKVGYTDRSSIAKVESGQVDLTQSKIKAFADALGTTPVELMDHDNVTEIDINKIIFDDYFPLHYCSNLSAGSFDELIEAEPDSVVYVPIKFQGRKKRLLAFKVNGTSMNNVIEDGSIVVVENNADDGIKFKDGTIVVAYYQGMVTVKRLIDQGDRIILSPDSTNKSHLPITILKEDNQVSIVGRVIWHMNPDDIEKSY